MDEKISEEKEKKEPERRALLAQAKKEFLATPSDNKESKQIAFEKWLDIAETFEELQEAYKASQVLSDEVMKNAAWLRLAALISNVHSP